MITVLLHCNIGVLITRAIIDRFNGHSSDGSSIGRYVLY